MLFRAVISRLVLAEGIRMVIMRRLSSSNSTVNAIMHGLLVVL